MTDEPDCNERGPGEHSEPPEAWQGSIGDFLRKIPNLPDPIRSRLQLLGGTDLLEGSRLAAWLEADDRLPADTPRLLWAALVLRHLQRSARDWQRLRKDLEAVVELVATRWGGTGVLVEKEDPVLEAFRAVDYRLAAYQAEAEQAEAAVAEAGWAWDAESRNLKVPTATKRRQLLRDLARACVRGLRATQNSSEVRETFASELAPFFPAEMLDTSKGSALYNAVDNAIRGK